MIFEVPTGVVADTLGRRASYLLGAATLFVSTLLYLAMWRFHGPFWGWAASSMLLLARRERAPSDPMGTAERARDLST